MAGQIPDYSKCLFNMHCPPRDTLLDLAPKLDKATLKPIVTALGPQMEHVGSTAVREAIEELKPCVSLHGHIHEQHCSDRVGDTVCFNPGSEYGAGHLRGVYLVFNDGVLSFAGLTREEFASSDAEESDEIVGNIAKSFPLGYLLDYMLRRLRKKKKEPRPDLTTRLSTLEDKVDQIARGQLALFKDKDKE